MTKNFSKIGAKLGLAVLAVTFISLPVLSFAATYAFVNTSGEVSTVISSNPNTAIMTAHNIGERSGVILLNTQANTDLIGDRVFGM